jgi:hypothetical protein
LQSDFLTMNHNELAQSVRELVHAQLSVLGEPHAASGEPIRETVLIRGGAYCGRRFESTAGHAIWFIEEGQIKFYSAEGRLVATLPTDGRARRPLRHAA